MARPLVWSHDQSQPLSIHHVFLFLPPSWKINPRQRTLCHGKQHSYKPVVFHPSSKKKKQKKKTAANVNRRVFLQLWALQQHGGMSKPFSSETGAPRQVAIPPPVPWAPCFAFLTTLASSQLSLPLFSPLLSSPLRSSIHPSVRPPAPSLPSPPLPSSCTGRAARALLQEAC